MLLWGRPNYVGAQARKREVQLYFAVADMPKLDAAGAPVWSPRYFAGLDDDGRPRFVSEQSAAVRSIYRAAPAIHMNRSTSSTR